MTLFIDSRTLRSLLLAVVLIAAILSGCGEQAEPPALPKPVVFRQKVSVPKEMVAAQAPTSVVEPAEKALALVVKPVEKTPAPVVKPVEKAPAPVVELAEKPPATVQEAPAVATETAALPPVEQPSKKVEEKAVVAQVPGPIVEIVEKAEPEPPADQKRPEDETAEAARPETPAEKEGERIAYLYDPEGKIDPFKPIVMTKPEGVTTRDLAKKRKREPMTPLEKVDLGQLKLVGVILSRSGNKALVEDPSGKGYIVTEGMYVGTNAGRVRRIGKDGIVVEEEIEDILSGKMKLKETPLILQRKLGEE